MTEIQRIIFVPAWTLAGALILFNVAFLLAAARRRRLERRFVVRCRLGYYGPTPGRGYCGNSGDLPIEKAYRYTRREARELAGNLGAEFEEIQA
jgi:hypothetical protein